MKNEEFPFPYNLDEFFTDPDSFNLQASFDFPLSPPSFKLNQPPHIEKGDSSTHPSPHLQPLQLKDNHPDSDISKDKQVITSCISTQDHTSKDSVQDCADHHHHQQQQLTPRQAHNVSQRRRRERVKKKMKTLRNLIPNCNKTDMASVLDEAIKYIELLKQQAQYCAWYQQQVEAAQQVGTWGDIQIPIASSATNSLVQAPPYLHYPLHQRVLSYHPMSLMQLNEQQLTSILPIPQILEDVATTTTTSTVEIDQGKKPLS